MTPALCLLLAVILAGGLTPVASAAPGDWFGIHVVDEATGRGVPLVDLKTVNDIHLTTDSNGYAAFLEPGLMDTSVHFTVSSHGYEYPADGFGYRGVTLTTTPGAIATIALRRVNIAERLYRITGGGIYRDSVLLGQSVPLREPVLNARVLGQDSVLTALYQGRVYWFWGDTNRPEYPLGNFHTPGATSLLPADGGLDPALGVDLTYFTGDSGFAAETAHLPGDGPTWLSGLTALTDDSGRERLFATYSKVRQDMSTHDCGIAEWDDATQRFSVAARFGSEPPALLRGNTFLREDRGVPYVYAASPYPHVRVRARVADFLDPAAYEAYTCYLPGTRDLDRAPDGALRWAWRTGTAPLRPSEQADLEKSGALRPGETPWQLRDALTGKPVQASVGSVYYNAYRDCWVMVTGEQWGTSLLGEIWYAEADDPLGPWVYARKVVTHDRYDFYNPTQHPMLDQEGGRLIYFEGTYTATFGGGPVRTPRYEYNQIMYRLDLADPRLSLPRAVRLEGAIAFYAPDHPGEGTVPVTREPVGAVTLGGEGAVLFHALPLDAPAPGATVVLYQTPGGALSTDPAAGGRPFCRVWPVPGSPATP